MATLLLVRHGRTTANASGVLAGRTPGVRLDDLGAEQAARAGSRIGTVPLVALVTSPQERCKQTARAIADAQRDGGRAATRTVTEKALAECDYGEWQGRPIKELVREPLWQTVQRQPSAAIFPGGESMVAMQHRAVAAVRRLDAAVTREHGPDAVWVAVSHGDIIKSVLADALGMHLDLFQRISVDPASVSIVRYAPDRPYVLASNTHDGDLSWLAPKPGKRRTRATARTTAWTTAATGAVIGGGAGPGRPDH